ncbi:MAG: flavin reductase family protein [Anaerolineales bacterium]|nr:flavin reductase family protein [Anaerolineales bacterium]
MEISSDALPRQAIYKILIGSVVPRPIGWISTINASGQPNLAPFSFFNVVCPKPPTVLFCPMIRGTDSNPKDTLNNVKATGEFVVNIVSEELMAAMIASSVEIAPDVNEFDLTGLATTPSVVVKPPRVAESPIHFECRVRKIIEIGNQPGGGSVVLGEIVHLHVDERVLIGEDKIDLAALRPIGRLAGSAYVRVTDIFEIERPKPQISPK